jgi:predicted nucleotidyltransferase
MEEHRCHTAVIYGSWARGDATPASDVDLLFVRETGATVRDARVVGGVYLDAFVYPESALDTLDPSFLRILDGVVLRERDGVGSELLARVGEMHHRGPPPMPDDQRLRPTPTASVERGRLARNCSGRVPRSLRSSVLAAECQALGQLAVFR